MRPHRFLLFLLFTSVVFAQDRAQPPSKKEQSIVARPSEMDRVRLETKAPSLRATGAEAEKAALAFLDWAGASTVRQREEVRKLITEARENNAVATAFCNEANKSAESDHSRALLALSVLGEMRSQAGIGCFVKLVHQPLPEKGTLADGEIVEQTALAMLQAKAIDGLAYLKSEKTDREVLWAAGKHPSRIVRAEAIDAYLWNHEDSAQARATLLKYVQPKERIFLDRLRKDSKSDKETFNRKLAAFLKAHPETAAPAPKRKEIKDEVPQLPKDNQPPVR